jgi:hypothetical protein
VPRLVAAASRNPALGAARGIQTSVLLLSHRCRRRVVGLCCGHASAWRMGRRRHFALATVTGDGCGVHAAGIGSIACIMYRRIKRGSRF